MDIPRMLELAERESARMVGKIDQHKASPKRVAYARRALVFWEGMARLAHVTAAHEAVKRG